MRIGAGDRLYIPSGALRIRMKDDGSLGGTVNAAIDPWLPDMAAFAEIGSDEVTLIENKGFPIRLISSRGSIYACAKSDLIRDILNNKDVHRLRQLVVHDDFKAIGVLDLDLARGSLQGGDPNNHLAAGDLYEPTNPNNSISGDQPLMDYLLMADKYPFRMVRLDGGNLGVVDVYDLQKLPVRVLLFMQLSHLEMLLVRLLCEDDSSFSDIVGSQAEIMYGSFGSFAGGPIKRIEKMYLGELLSKATQRHMIELDSGEIRAITQYRNFIAHGPRWYITRRSDVSCLVNFVRLVRGLIETLESK